MLKLAENLNAQGSINENYVVLLRNGKAGEFSPVHYLIETDSSFVNKMNAIQGEMSDAGISLTTEQIKISWVRWLESGRLGKSSVVAKELDESRFMRVFGDGYGSCAFPTISALLRNVREGYAK